MYPSELEEGPQDLSSMLKNLAFQLVLDGEVSQVAHHRRDQCVMAGASDEECRRIWNSALTFSQRPGAPSPLNTVRRFHYAQASASMIASGMLS